MKTAALFLVSALIVFSSCENFTWFQSEGTVKKNIQGTWTRQFLSHDDIINKHESWTFKDGQVFILRYDNSFPDSCSAWPPMCDEGANDIIDTDTDTIIDDKGNYKVDAKIDKVFLKTSELTTPQQVNNYNYKWTVVELDTDILYIAADGTDEVVQREFVKVK